MKFPRWKNGQASSATHDVPKAKTPKPKPRTLAPPGEAFQPPKPKSKPAPRSNTPAKKDPRTSQATAKSSVASNKTNTDRVMKSGDNLEPPTSGRKGRQSKATLPGMISILNSHSPSTVKFSNTAKQSVLVRPTAKTQRYQKQQAVYVSLKTAVEMVGTRKSKDSKYVFDFMEFPKEVRTEIWRHAVVDPCYFVWPGSKTGSEQPDLAMVSRGIRAEALPIFYAENIFAIDVSPSKEAGRGGVAQLSGGKKKTEGQNQAAKGIAVIKKWANGLKREDGRPVWFGSIRRWAFSYEAETMNGKDDQSFIVSINLRRAPEGWWVDGVPVVHREAFCTLPGHEQYKTCIPSKTPSKLNDDIIKALNAARGRHISGEVIVRLAIAIQSRVEELVECRCARMSIES